MSRFPVLNDVSFVGIKRWADQLVRALDQESIRTGSLFDNERYQISNYTASHVLDVSAASATTVGTVLATLIERLETAGKLPTKGP